MKTSGLHSRNSNGIRSALVSICVLAALTNAPIAQASVLSWTINGPGTTDTTTAGATTRLDYGLTGPSVYSEQSWTARATAVEAGDYVFNWQYWGFHAFFDTHAFLTASSKSAVTTLVNARPFDGFYYAGTYTFANVNAGDTLQFAFGGRNFDSNHTLIGAVVLDQQNKVPEPASLALLGMGLLGLVAVRRKRVN